MYRLVRKSRTPKLRWNEFENCIWKLSKVPSSLAKRIRGWSSACSLFVCDSREKTEVRKRNSKENLHEGTREDAKRRRNERMRKALLTDAKTLGIVAKVKQTTVAVARFRSTLVEETFFQTAFLPRLHCGIIVPIRHYHRGGLNENDVSPRSILSAPAKVD